jgi:hypothetical protein
MVFDACKDKGVRSELEVWRILCYENVAALTERPADLIEFQMAPLFGCQNWGSFWHHFGFSSVAYLAEIINPTALRHPLIYTDLTRTHNFDY